MQPLYRVHYKTLRVGLYYISQFMYKIMTPNFFMIGSHTALPYHSEHTLIIDGIWVWTEIHILRQTLLYCLAGKTSTV